MATYRAAVFVVETAMIFATAVMLRAPMMWWSCQDVGHVSTITQAAYHTREEIGNGADNKVEGSWEEDGLDNSEKDAGDYKPRKVMHRCHDGRDGAPDNHAAANVDARPFDATGDHVGRDLEEDCEADLNADRRLVFDRRQVKVLFNIGKLCTGDILSIEIVEDIHGDQDGHYNEIHLERRPTTEGLVLGVWKRCQLDGHWQAILGLGGLDRFVLF
ncbi:hypothetical protein HG530_007791 [Fusarium avenaceum]|nr:hypothetical protein HG530_007791 [Fusarium avenaceum]